MEINVIDAGCGVGKTTAMINLINQSEDSERFLYITPFLTEVERIKKSCKNKNFQEPIEKPTKTEDLIRLIEKGYNVVSTHALFQKLTDRVLDLTQFNDYILIVDEAADVIEEIDITKNDLKTIVKEYITIKDDMSVVWNEEKKDYEGRFDDYKHMIDMGGVKAHRSDSGEIISLAWVWRTRTVFMQRHFTCYRYLRGRSPGTASIWKPCTAKISLAHPAHDEFHASA